VLVFLFLSLALQTAHEIRLRKNFSAPASPGSARKSASPANPEFVASLQTAYA
jgi:hypothetical protein